MNTANKKTVDPYWAPIAADLVKDLRRRWGQGWDALGHELRMALAAERVLAVVCGWSTEADAGCVVGNAAALRREVMRLVSPEGE